MTLIADDFHPALDRRGNSELVRLIGELDHFRGTWRKMQEIRAERLVQLRQVTTIESTASSTRIEGVELTDAEVARVLDGIRSGSFRARDEEEVRSYAELLTLIYESHAEIPLTENHVKQRRRTGFRSCDAALPLGCIKRDVAEKESQATREDVYQIRHPHGYPPDACVLVMVSTTSAW